MRALVYQVLGRRPCEYREVSYEVVDLTGERPDSESVKLSSQALYLRETRAGNEAELVYVCPSSLYGELLKPGSGPACGSSKSVRGPASPGKLLEELADVDMLRERFREEVEGALGADFNFDVVVVNAVGKYRVGEREVYFDSTPDAASVELFADMLRRIRERSGGVKLVADISTGHNVYIVSLLEALRGVAVYDKLRRGVSGREVGTFYAVSEPVGPGQQLRVFVCEYDVKAFFALPYDPAKPDKLSKLEQYLEGVGPEDREKISKKYESLKRDLERLLENLAVAFNAIRYNAPLALYYRELTDLGLSTKRLEGEVLRFIEEQSRPKPSPDEGRIVAAKWRRRNVFDLFYSLAIYEWIANEMEGSQGELEWVGVDELEKRALGIYEKLGLQLNRRFLERDLREIRGVRKGERQPPEKGVEGLRASDVKRNFFAHSGLEKTVVEVEEREGRVEVRYKRDRLNEIRSWLLRPED